MTIQNTQYSVVMATYKNDSPVWLREAIDSMLTQTIAPDEIIVIVDGQIPDELKSTIDSYAEKITAIYLRKNQGLWNALNTGIKAARNELIARMDADDISLPDRIEKQLRKFAEHEEISILSGAVAEFEKSPEQIIAHRRVPLTRAEITHFAKFRSPFNHPAVMFKKSDVLRLGGVLSLDAQRRLRPMDTHVDKRMRRRKPARYSTILPSR